MPGMSRIRISQDIELDVLIEGEGEPIVLVMGLGAQRIFWPEGFRALLVKRGFQVITFDNRDTGESTWLFDAPVPKPMGVLLKKYMGLPIRLPYTLEDLADDVVGLMDALSLERAHVAGVSLGGMIAQLTAARHPGRVRSLTSIMSAMGGHIEMMPTPAALRAMFKKPSPGRQGFVDDNMALFEIIGAPMDDMGRAFLSTLVGSMWDRGHYDDGFARQFAAVIAAKDRRRLLSKLKLPTLVVHGVHDSLIRPGGGRRMAKTIPGARLLVLDNMGHDLPMPTWRPIAKAMQALATPGLAPA